MEIKRGVVAGQSSRIVELVGDPMKRNLPMFCPSTDHAFDTLPLPLKYDCWRNVGFLWFKALQSWSIDVNGCKLPLSHDIPMQATTMEKWKFPIPMLDRNKVPILSLADQGFWLPGLFDLDNFQAELLDVRMKDLQTVSDGQKELQHFKCNRPLVSKTKNAVVQKKLMHKRENDFKAMNIVWVSRKLHLPLTFQRRTREGFVDRRLVLPVFLFFRWRQRHILWKQDPLESLWFSRYLLYLCCSS